MPELAIGYSIGFIATLLFTLLFAFGSIQKATRPKATQLQKNLEKVNLFWSESRGALVAREPDSHNVEKNSLVKSVVITGALFTFLSWIGLIFLGVLYFSLITVGRSRLERNIFNSELVEKDLNPEQVQMLVQSFS